MNSNINYNYNDMTIMEKFMSLPISMYIFMIAIPVIVGLFIVFLLVRWAGGKTTTNHKTYAPMGGTILAASSRFTHQTESRVKIKQNNGGGGGHGGGGHRGGGHRSGGHRSGGHRGGGHRGGGHRGGGRGHR